MKVKRFVAADMRRALDLVKQEMGADAVILSTNRTKQGVEIITSLTTPDQWSALSSEKIESLESKPSLGTKSAATNSRRAEETGMETVPLRSDGAWVGNSIMAYLNEKQKQQSSKQQQVVRHKPPTVRQSSQMRQPPKPSVAKNQAIASEPKPSVAGDEDLIYNSDKFAAYEAFSEYETVFNPESQLRRRDTISTKEVFTPAQYTAPPAVAAQTPASPNRSEPEQTTADSGEQSRGSWWNSNFQVGSYQFNFKPDYDLYSAVTLGDGCQYDVNEESEIELNYDATEVDSTVDTIEQAADHSGENTLNAEVDDEYSDDNTSLEHPVLDFSEKNCANDSFNIFDTTEFLEIESIKNEIADMREILQTQLDRLLSSSQSKKPRDKATPIQFNSITATLNRRLQHLGLGAEEIDKLLTKVDPRASLADAWTEALAVLAHQLPVQGRDIVDKGGFYSLVGSTGSGKTATLSKLAARYVLKHGSKGVAIVSMDIHHHSGQETLQRLGRILNIPVYTVTDVGHLRYQLDELCDHSLVLVDTPSFALGDSRLKNYLSHIRRLPQLKNILVMAANTQQRVMQASLHAYKPSGLHACILTKLDDTLSLGEALTVIMQERLPIIYTTSGQDVTKDINVARAHQVVTRAVSLLKQEGRRRRLMQQRTVRSSARKLPHYRQSVMM